MSILDMTQDQVMDIRSRRMEINLSITNKQSDFGMLLENTLTNATVQDDGALKFSPKAYINIDIAPYIKEYWRDNVITSICSDNAVEVRRIPEVNPDVLTSNVRCASVYIGLCHVMKDININMVASQHTSRHAPVVFDICNNIKFENTNINFECTHNNIFPQHILSFRSCNSVDYSGLTSNAEEISHYTIDGFPEELSQLFDSSYMCLVYDNKKNTQLFMPVKNMRKAIAITNNPQRYELMSFVWKLKEGARLSDIFPTKNFPDLELYAIHNNNVQLTFVKKGTNSCRIFNFSRVPKNSSEMDDMYEMTADGWYVIWSTRY